MKHIIIISTVVVFLLFILINKKTGNEKPVVQAYPWQVSILADGSSQVFGIVLGKTSLKKVDAILKIAPKMALFEVNNKMTLEAYYKNISLGGLIGSFIFTLDITAEQLREIKNKSAQKKPAENNGFRYELDKPTADKSKTFIVKNLIYIPAVQLDEKMIVKRFGKPAQKIKIKAKEVSRHYLYPEKGLDLIYHEEGKEVLQYIEPKNFNLLLAPLLSD